MFSALTQLLNFNNKNIYANPIKASQDKKIEGMFEYLFNKYLDDLKSNNSDSSILKYFLNETNENYIKSTTPEKIVIDYISGMTDDFFNNEFRAQLLPESFGMNIK